MGQWRAELMRYRMGTVGSEANTTLISEQMDQASASMSEEEGMMIFENQCLIGLMYSLCLTPPRHHNRSSRDRKETHCTYGITPSMAAL